MEHLIFLAAFLLGFAAGAFAVGKDEREEISADFTLSDEDAETVRQYVNFLNYDERTGWNKHEEN